MQIAAAETDYAVEFLPDDKHVLYGAGDSWFIRTADASAEAVTVSAGSEAVSQIAAGASTWVPLPPLGEIVHVTQGELVRYKP